MQHKDLTLQRIAEVIAAIGTPDFPPCLSTLLREVAPYSYTVVFGYRGASRPLDLYDDFPEDRRKVFVTDYQEGPYLLDPLYLSSVGGQAPGLYRMREIAPDRFYQGEYFRNYYIQTGLAEEIGFLIDVGDDSVVVLSLMRTDRPFAGREMRALQAMAPVVLAVGRRHWADLGARFTDASNGKGKAAMEGQIERSFHSFGEGVLTPREREVVEYTLKGHSAEAVGRALGISPGTVRIHRRNIYAKLRISSQGELFSRFIGTIGKV